jgi:hypothetical protein
MQRQTTFDEAVRRVLELSADLQIKRRASTKYSLEFHDYSVAIAAYGKVLEALTTVQHKKEERSPSVSVLGPLQASLESRAVA